MLDQVLKLGDPRLYEAAAPVLPEEVPALLPAAARMRELIFEFRRVYGAGRAIAAPQIGLMKRLVVWEARNGPALLFNPEFLMLSEEMFELWDDCMSFPNLLVRLRRHRSCTLRFRDADWQEQVWHLEDDLAELIQHEHDHLDGVLATQRALGPQAFRWR